MARDPYRGFTLAEVLVASTISAFVALVAVGALKTVTDGAHLVRQAGEASAEVGFAARLLARDLTNFYRDPDPRSMQLVGASQSSGEAPTAFLRFYTVGRAPARGGQPEGDVYEVEYILKQTADLEGSPDENAPRSLLLRRLWPNPDRDREPGGILVPVAQDIDVFQIRFSDGREWTDSWPEETQTLPRLIEVTLATLPREGRPASIETFTVNFTRLATTPPDGQVGPSAPDQQGQQGQGPNGSSPAPQGGGGPGGPR
ncbi:MAG: prepilin-type N-terminal cleavage/methylation domain-containing protein [Phycisphaerales bacterium]|nr:MAG: prepilin-type N-terminal cleavage/methylation domain-containing protein [Phycisphaerales bacterium]